MRILLISPLASPNYWPTTYNIGLGYIASCLIQDGHKVSVLDIEGFRYDKKQVIEKIRKSKCDVIGIGSPITGYRYTKWLVNQIKKIKPKVRIWLGNSIVSPAPRVVLKDLPIDVAVLNEGEDSVKELARVEEEGGDLNEVQGICFKKGAKIIHTPPRGAIGDIDNIPFPSWDLFPQHIYMNNQAAFMPTPVGYFISSRGCPYNCTYCYHSFYGSKIRYHSPERVIEEISIFKKKYKIKSAFFVDDLFIGDKKRVYDICSLIIKKRLNINFACAGRVNLVDLDLLKTMRSAGCLLMGFGIESGSNKILKTINKSVTVDQAERAIQLCRKARIYPNCSFMIGNVGETEETVSETVDFMVRNNLDPVEFYITRPYPGTQLYEYAKGKGLIKDEAAFFESYGEQRDLLLNVSGMPDQKLLDLKEKAEAIVRYYFFKHYKMLQTI